jgi:NADH:ubiquinone oxidoreductase subunit D
MAQEQTFSLAVEKLLHCDVPKRARAWKMKYTGAVPEVIVTLVMACAIMRLASEACF